jgi:tellurite resistance protein
MTAPSDYARQLASMAQEERAALERSHGIELDFTPASLEALDRLLGSSPDAVFPEGERTPLAVYLGEIIRRSVGAVWCEDGVFGVHLRKVGGVNLMAQPIQWVNKRLDRGAAHALSAKFAMLMDRIRGGAKPDEAAVPFSSGHRGNEDPGVEEILVRAPAIMFYLIAAADGHVDAGESDRFRELLAGYMDIASPLMQRAVQVMLPRLNHYFAYLASPDFDREEVLTELRATLDEKHPDEAVAFKQALIALGRTIAEASGGGFLGLGDPISDEEHSALKEVAQALGMR